MARSGMLNRRIELWRKTSTKNEYGEYDESWALLSTVRAYVHRNTGVQTVDNDEVFNTTKLNLSLRKQLNITDMDRFKVEGNLYQIEFIQSDDTYRWLTIRCTRINE